MAAVVTVQRPARSISPCARLLATAFFVYAPRHVGLCRRHRDDRHAPPRTAARPPTRRRPPTPERPLTRDDRRPGTGNCKKAAPSNVCGVSPQCGCGPSQTCEVDQNALDGISSCVAAGSKAIAHGVHADHRVRAGPHLHLRLLSPLLRHRRRQVPAAGHRQLRQPHRQLVEPHPQPARVPAELHARRRQLVRRRRGQLRPRRQGRHRLLPGRLEHRSCSSSNPFDLPGGLRLPHAATLCKQWCKVGTTCASGACASLNTPR